MVAGSPHTVNEKMDEILASLRRIIAEDEANRPQMGADIAALAATVAASQSIANAKAESSEIGALNVAMAAAVRASRAREFGLEWLALGLGLASIHLLFVAAPRAALTFLDAVVIVMTAGGGIVMYLFESKRGSDLRELSKELLAHGAQSGNEVDNKSGDRVDGKKP